MTNERAATTKIWAKGYELDPLIERFEAARNAALDAALARYDIWGSLAHARMLHTIGLLTASEWRALHHALRDLLTLADAGDLRPAAAEEDIHTTIENALIAHVGDAGKKIHTGRSRNDQVLLDLRLYAKETVPALANALLDTAAALLQLAQTHEWTPMPGYTHMQRAMLSSVGLWAAAHAEALLDDAIPLAAAYALNDRSPLGSAAAYGVPLPLDREQVARLLGFSAIHHNTLAAGNARGKGEAAIVQALALIMLDLSKWAQDVLLFTTSEFGFFSVPQELSGGSSIMPQKRNLDALELVRARAHTVIAAQGQMLTTLAGLPSGYNMDYQETKAPLLDSIALCGDALRVVTLYATRLTIHEDRLRAACSPDLFAADRAYALAATGATFRDAYRAVAAQRPTDAPDLAPDLAAHLRLRSATGAPGALRLDHTLARLAAERAAWAERNDAFTTAIAALIHDPAADSAADGAPDTSTHG